MEPLKIPKALRVAKFQKTKPLFHTAAPQLSFGLPPAVQSHVQLTLCPKYLNYHRDTFYLYDKKKLSYTEVVEGIVKCFDLQHRIFLQFFFGRLSSMARHGDDTAEFAVVMYASEALMDR